MLHLNDSSNCKNRSREWCQTAQSYPAPDLYQCRVGGGWSATRSKGTYCSCRSKQPGVRLWCKPSVSLLGRGVRIQSSGGRSHSPFWSSLSPCLPPAWYNSVKSSYHPPIALPNSLYWPPQAGVNLPLASLDPAWCRLMHVHPSACPAPESSQMWGSCSRDLCQPSMILGLHSKRVKGVIKDSFSSSAK